MKRIRIYALLGSALLAMLTTTAQAAVSLSVGIHEPGFYGRINLGDYPSPPVMRSAPVMVVQGHPRAAPRAPIYLHVPPYQMDQWPQYCGQYSACSQPVYFVQERWYRDVYAPRYYPVQQRGPAHWDRRDYRDQRHHRDHPRSQGHGQGRGHGHDRHDRR